MPGLAAGRLPQGDGIHLSAEELIALRPRCHALRLPMRQPAASALAGAYRARLDAVAPGAQRIVDKMWQNFEFLGFAALLLPAAQRSPFLAGPTRHSIY